LVGEPHATDLGEGVRVAYRRTGDDGYVQEMQIPWRLLCHDDPPAIQAGQVLRIGLEFLWGDPTGNTWPVHRYADNLQPDQTSREFFWSAYRAWGDVTLRPAGNLTPRRYVAAEGLLTGPVPIQIEVPVSATRFTLVIENTDGRRVRNLAADLSP